MPIELPPSPLPEKTLSKRQLKMRERDRQRQTEADRWRQHPNQTAFRTAERLYRPSLASDPPSTLVTYATCQDRAAHFKPLDLSGDMTKLSRLWLSGGSDGQVGQRPTVVEVKGAPGLVYLPGFLSEEHQRRLVYEALFTLPIPPNKSNLDAHYVMPTRGLFPTLLAEPFSPIPQKEGGGGILPKDMVGKWRWSTLGQQYDWASKTYPPDDRVPFPPSLAELTAAIAHALPPSHRDPQHSFTAEAGVVNYYRPGHTLTGHVDKSEENMEAPLVSLSLGCTGVLLIGPGPEVEPVALEVRSGDVLAMCGASRAYYHGVPVVWEGTCPAYLREEEKYVGEEAEGKACAKYIGQTRINMNVRQASLPINT